RGLLAAVFRGGLPRRLGLLRRLLLTTALTDPGCGARVDGLRLDQRSAEAETTHTAHAAETAKAEATQAAHAAHATPPPPQAATAAEATQAATEAATQAATRTAEAPQGVQAADTARVQLRGAGRLGELLPGALDTLRCHLGAQPPGDLLCGHEQNLALCDG